MKKDLFRSQQSDVTIIDSISAEIVLEKALLDFRKRKFNRKLTNPYKIKTKVNS